MYAYILATVILWPSFLVFLALIVPLPRFLTTIPLAVLSVLTAKFPFFGAFNASIMGIVSYLALSHFLWQAGKWGRAYQSVSAPTFNTLEAEYDYLGRKWRVERDLYMNLLAVVLMLALHSLGGMMRKLRRLEDDLSKDKKNK